MARRADWEGQQDRSPGRRQPYGKGATRERKGPTPVLEGVRCGVTLLMGLMALMAVPPQLPLLPSVAVAPLPPKGVPLPPASATWSEVRQMNAHHDKNTSHAVMARRFEPRDSRDDFPAPPWAARALFEHVLGDDRPSRRMSCLEPAFGAGHMAEVLKEYVERVDARDAYDYGYGDVRDFLLEPYRAGSYDWVITNPPFRLAQEFVIKGLEVARIGLAIVARTT